MSEAAINATLYEATRREVWALCFRITGSAADADELAQETFTRALEVGPERRDRTRSAAEDLRPWLLRVAANLSRDRLRRRKRQAYDGPWLPTPVALEARDPEPWPDARYGRLESASMAFLVALEALTPSQRAVLVLRDVLDLSTARVAAALELSVANVKTTLHRARKAMAGYDARRVAPSPALVRRHRGALLRFMAALATGRPQDLEALLTADARVVQDAGGEFVSARQVLEGPRTVARFMCGILRRGEHRVTGVDERLFAGVPGWIIANTSALESYRPVAPRLLMTLDVDAAGDVRAIYSLLATAKLEQALAPSPLAL